MVHHPAPSDECVAGTNHRTTLALSPSRFKSKSAEREKWIQAHAPALLTSFGIPAGGSGKVQNSFNFRVGWNKSPLRRLHAHLENRGLKVHFCSTTPRLTRVRQDGKGVEEWGSFLAFDETRRVEFMESPEEKRKKKSTW